MKVYVLIDWKEEHVIGVYKYEEEALNDSRLVRYKHDNWTIAKRDLVDE